MGKPEWQRAKEATIQGGLSSSGKAVVWAPGLAFLALAMHKLTPASTHLLSSPASYT